MIAANDGAGNNATEPVTEVTTPNSAPAGPAGEDDDTETGFMPLD